MANSADIMSKERHLGYLDVVERDKVEIHKVGISAGHLIQTRIVIEVGIAPASVARKSEDAS